MSSNTATSEPHIIATSMNTMNGPPSTTPLSKPSQDVKSANQQIHQQAASTAEQLEVNLKSDWDPIQLASLLHTLTIHDLPLDIITKYRLGRLVKSIKKKAQEKDNQPIIDVSDQIMCKWRDLLPTKDNQASSRSPTLSPVSSPKNQERAAPKSLTTNSATVPSTSSTQQQSAPFKLAIQKDPTPKPKAITNTSFFDTLKGPSSYSNTVRPSFSGERSTPSHVSLQSLLNTMKRDSASTSLTSTGTVTTKKRTIETDSNASSITDAPKKARTRRVRFKPDHQLVNVRIYERDPEEWNFGQMDADHAHDMGISEGQVLSQGCHSQQGQLDPRAHVSGAAWYPPIPVDIPTNCALPWPKQSQEIVAQQRREQRTAPFNYENLDRIPDSPAEPTDMHMNHSTPVIIPLFEIDEEQIRFTQRQTEEDQQQGQQEQQIEMEQHQQQQYQQNQQQYTKNEVMDPVNLVQSQQPSFSSPYQQYQPQQVKAEPSYAGFNNQLPYQPQPQQQFQPQQYQLQPPQFQPHQFQPLQPQPQQFQQPQQPTSEQMSILLNSGLLGALSEMVRNLPTSGAQPLAQYMPNQQQSVPQQPYTSPIPQYQPQYIPSTEQQQPAFNRPQNNNKKKPFKSGKFTQNARGGGSKNKKRKRPNPNIPRAGHAPSKGPGGSGGGGARKPFGGPSRPF